MAINETGKPANAQNIDTKIAEGGEDIARAIKVRIENLGPVSKIGPTVVQVNEPDQDYKYAQQEKRQVHILFVGDVITNIVYQQAQNYQT